MESPPTGFLWLSWYWWMLIGLAAAIFALWGWSLAASSKAPPYQGVERRRTDRAKSNGIGRP